jgi:putative hydrolase of the HAD superfamily
MVDVDGVLVNGRPSDGRPWASDIEADLGIKSTDLQREFFTPHWDDIVTGRQDLGEKLRPALARIAPDLSPEEFITYWFENDARLNLQLLGELNHQRRTGIKIYLATNQEHLRASYLIDQLGLGQHFDGIYYSAALACRKPDIEFYERITTLSGFPPDQLLLIDDTPANVSTAKKLGWNAVEWVKGSCLAAELAKLQSKQ